jgi:hypothetical protein
MAVSRSKKPERPTAAGTSQPDSSPSDWLAALGAPETNGAPSKDWLTREQVSTLIDRKRFATQQYLASAIKNGKVEMKKFNIPRSDGAKHFTPHYRIIK